LKRGEMMTDEMQKNTKTATGNIDTLPDMVFDRLTWPRQIGVTQDSTLVMRI